MGDVVLDASAVLALLNAEAGGDEVAAVLPGARISTVNLSEVVAKLDEHAMPEVAIREAVCGLGLIVVPFDVHAAYAAGTLRSATKKYGLGLGDRACLTLGRRLDLPVLTADRRWAELGLGIEIRVIRTPLR